MPEDKTALLQSIAETESRLREIDKEREALTTHLNNLKHKLAAFRNTSLQTTDGLSSVNTQSSPMEKIALFRSLFKGREDVYPKLWTGKNGNKGYSPVCENEWKPGLCRKPAIKCGECENRKFSPLTYDVIRRHLDGTITIGVHRKPLLEQWKARLSSFLGIPAKKIGHIGGGKDKATGFIDVAMIQSLENRGEVDERVKNYGHIIVDEYHHISAVSFERVMMEANARFVIGLTATPYRRDGHQPIISMQCGPVRHHMKTMQEGISLFICKLITRPTDFSCAWSDNDKIHSLWPLLIKDEQRNQMIFEDIMSALEEGRSPIMLTERKEHLEILREKLQNFVKHIIVLHGGMKARERKEMLARLTDIPDAEERLILATGPYIGEGFDDPRLDTLFLAMPFSFKGKMVQYAGRLHRPYNGKTEVRVYDYLDRNIPVLQRMYKRRLKAYKALGYVESHVGIPITR